MIAKDCNHEESGRLKCSAQKYIGWDKQAYRAIMLYTFYCGVSGVSHFLSYKYTVQVQGVFFHWASP